MANEMKLRWLRDKGAFSGSGDNERFYLLENFDQGGLDQAIEQYRALGSDEERQAYCLMLAREMEAPGAVEPGEVEMAADHFRQYLDAAVE